MKKTSFFSPSVSRRKGIALLSLLLSVLLLSSCGIITIGGKETLPPETVPLTDPPTEPVTDPETLDPDFHPSDFQDGEALDLASLETLPKVDLGGVLFRVVTSSPAFFAPEDVSSEEGSASPVDVAKYRRNKAVAERYNVLLTYYGIPADALPDEVREASYAETYLGDLIEIDGDACFASFAAGGVTSNLLSLPHTDYTAPYFDQRCVAQCSAGNRVYAVCGDANRDFEGTYCVFWNKDLTGDEDLYALVREGNWTWEKMLSLSAEADLLGAASLPESDLLALACSGSNLLRTGAGLHPEAFDDVSPVEAAVVLARTLSSLTFLPEFEEEPEDIPETEPETGITETEPLPEAETEEPTETEAADETDVSETSASETEVPDPVVPAPLPRTDPSLKAFRAGKAAFCIGEAKDLASLNAPGLHWGILPLPKVSASQESYPSLQSRRTLFTAISSMASHDNTGYLLQALNAASGNAAREAFLSEALSEHVSSSDDIWMLRRIYGSQFCDFGWMISCDDYNSVAKASKLAFQSAVASDRTFSYFYDAASVTLLYWNPINFPM